MKNNIYNLNKIKTDEKEISFFEMVFDNLNPEEQRVFIQSAEALSNQFIDSDRRIRYGLKPIRNNNAYSILLADFTVYFFLKDGVENLTRIPTKNPENHQRITFEKDGKTFTAEGIPYFLEEESLEETLSNSSFQVCGPEKDKTLENHLYFHVLFESPKREVRNQFVRKPKSFYLIGYNTVEDFMKNGVLKTTKITDLKTGLEEEVEAYHLALKNIRSLEKN